MNVPKTQPARAAAGLFALGLAVLLATAVLPGPLQGTTQPAAAAVKWDYNSQEVETPSLQAKLGELSNDGWEVFSIVPHESLVDPGTDNRPRLKVEKLIVTSRKAK